MKKLNHIQLFEQFTSELSEQDKDAVNKIMSVSNQSWFTDGEDAPEEFSEYFENFETENTEIEYAVEICTGGPGFTDVWLERNELISDIMREEPDITEEEIEDSNRNWFASERAIIINNLAKYKK